MTKSDITYIVGSVFSTMTAVLYCCTRWFVIKLPRYYPLEHTWKWSKEPSVPSQGWYGMQAFAFLGAAAIALAVYLLLRSTVFRESQLKPTLAKLLGVIATVTIIACMGYIVYYEFEKWSVF